MSLYTELLDLENQIRQRGNVDSNSAILLHAKAHMFHNKRMHKKALFELAKHNIEHFSVDSLD